ncbi:MAG: autotransporter-associated beta strand repeat-containing protein, partial [Rhodoferax sp.]|nr:autotransporter-associated beta strand repeat-containing protein [Rhodoferax sp.]
MVSFKSNASGLSSFAGTIGDQYKPLNVEVLGATSLANNATTVGTQTYQGTVTISASTTTLSTTNSDVYFGSTLNASLAGKALTISNGTGDTTFTGAVGGVAALGNMTLTTDVLTAAAIKLQGNLRITNAGTSTISGIISNGASAASLTKAGAGSLLLTATNTYSGTTTISAGVLQLGNNSATGTINNSAIVNNAQLLFDYSTDTTVASNIS